MKDFPDIETTKPLISIIIPSYRKSDVIVPCLDRLTSILAETSSEIIVVIDGDVDGTAAKLVSHNSRFRILTLPENKGKGFAIRKGFEVVTGEFVCFFDADLDIEPKVVKTQLNELKENAAISGVIANKFHADSILVYPRHRKIFSFGLFLLQRFLFGLPYRDTQTGAKTFRYSEIADIVPNLRTNGFLFDIELLYQMKKKHLQLSQCSVEISHSGDSTVNWRDIFFLLLNLIFLRIEILKDSPRIVNFLRRTSRKLSKNSTDDLSD